MDAKKRALLGTLFNRALLVSPNPISENIFPDPADHFLLELAVTAQASIIVTGDKKLLSIKRAKGIKILGPEDFCRIVKLK